MKVHVIVKTHELALKGKNRPWFMRRLVENLRLSTQGAGVQEVWQGHMLVGLTLEDKACWDAVADRVKQCFGVAKFFMAYHVPRDLEEVKKVLPVLLDQHSFQSFRITTNRADKRFPLKSGEINRHMGDFVREYTGAKVDLGNPGLQIYLDVLPTGMLLHFEEVSAYGGLPVGVSGDVMAMLSGGLDSPVAAWHMMKRGCRAKFVHFHSYPLVDRSSIDKSVELVNHLTRNQYRSSLFLVPLSEIQKNVIVSTPPPYRVILYRRFMVRITDVLARRCGAKAIVTGESCGQVSSQTLENIAVIEEAASIPILRPLVGFNKEEIVNVAREIETFPISIQPDQDCCSLFVPRHPETRADLETVSRLEAGLPVDELIRDALDHTEIKEFRSETVAQHVI